MVQFARDNLGCRLDSWKEIASFFGRDERTVRRWEKERALPVHRIPGAAKGRVFAYQAALQEWLSTSESLRDAAQPEPPNRKPLRNRSSFPVLERAKSGWRPWQSPLL